MLGQDGQKHVALVIASPLENVIKKKKAPSKLSQTAIAEGEDILADVMNLSGIGDMLELMDDDDFEPEGTITSFARNQLDRDLVASDPGLPIIDHTSPSIAHISPTPAPPRLPYQAATKSALVTMQGGGSLRMADKHPHSIRHVVSLDTCPRPMARHNTRLPREPMTGTSNRTPMEGNNTHVTRQHAPCTANGGPSLHTEVGTVHASPRDSRHVSVVDRRPVSQQLGSNAEAWLPSECQAFYWSYRLSWQYINI